MDKVHLGQALWLADRLSKLANNQIAPSKIVGTGYKNARAVAFQYLSSELTRVLLEAAQATHDSRD